MKNFCSKGNTFLRITFNDIIFRHFNNKQKKIKYLKMSAKSLDGIQMFNIQIKFYLIKRAKQSFLNL